MNKKLFDDRPNVKLQKRNRLPENPDEHSQGRFPKWLHRRLPKGSALFNTGKLIQNKHLYTVCEEAKCPNRLECYSNKTATFLVLGKACTRACGFCDIDFSKLPAAPDKNEPDHIVKSVNALGLKHVVITMVARDDLADNGAQHLVNIMKALRTNDADVTIELLTSDFQGNTNCLDIVLRESPEVFNHNIETVRELTPKVRHKATYDRTLNVLKYAAKSKQAGYIKSGIMVGLGESPDQVYETLKDLKEAGCDIVTIGQYLQANFKKLPVKAFITPEQFDEYKAYGEKLGFKQVYSGPFVRSSYNAGLLLNNIKRQHA